MDLKAFYKLTYGLYILSSEFEGKAAGCVVNTLTQVTAEPVKVAVAVSKDNFTTQIIAKSGRFAATSLLHEIVEPFASGKVVGCDGTIQRAFGRMC